MTLMPRRELPTSRRPSSSREGLVEGNVRLVDRCPGLVSGARGLRTKLGEHRLVPTAGEEVTQLEVELEASLNHLHQVVERYWEREWRAGHKGSGWYPEDHLWRAAHGYLDVMHGLAGRLSPEGGESDG